MYKTILMPVAPDHEADLSKVLEAARALAADGAKITALAVIEPVPAYVAASLPEGHAKTALEGVRKTLAEILAGHDDVEKVVMTGHASIAILEYAEAHGTDCIVLEARGSARPEFLLGSIAHRIARRAKCSVHVCR